MRDNPPKSLSPNAGAAVCLLTKHELIDMLVAEIGALDGGERALLTAIEELADKICAGRGRRTPKIVKQFDALQSGKIAARHLLRRDYATNARKRLHGLRVVKDKDQ